MSTTETALFDGYRNPALIRALAKEIAAEAKGLSPVNIMEVCGGHTHVIMQYGLNLLMPENVRFVHGPGCPVCVMPKERIDHAMALAKLPNVILVTLGDMIKVPGSNGSLANARGEGADVRFVYSPTDALKIARENPDKSVIFFAIGFETTTPMTAAIVESALKEGLKNLFFHINHITVPEAVAALLDSDECQIDALIGPAHVSVITGAKIYAPLVERFHIPVVVSGFEPVDIMEGVLRIVRQKKANEAKLDNEYTRSVSFEGNTKAQALVDRVFEKREHFRWRGLGDIPSSALRLRPEFAALDAETRFAEALPQKPIDDHKACLCGTILRGAAKPTNCKLFKTVCTPQNPYGSCMVSSEGACAAYYRYGESEIS